MFRVLVALQRQIARGLRALVHRAETDADITAEVQHYVDQSAAELVKRGVSVEAAKRAARIEIGNVTVAREQVREYGWENNVDTFAADVRYAMRRLRATPAVSAAVVVTLALGIGAATAIFSAVNPVLFESLPYPNAKQLAMIVENNPDGSRNPGTFGMYREIAARSRSIEGVAAFKQWQPTMTGPEQPERFDGQRVSASYFRVLGIAPAIGRDFQNADDAPGQPNVVLLSDALWRRRFAADPEIVGSRVTLDGNMFIVVGVLPSRFENVLAPQAELWSPLQYDMTQGRAWGHHLRLIARVRSGTSMEQAAREVVAIGHQVLKELRPETYANDVEVTAVSLQGDLTRGVRPALLALLAAVTLVLTIACMNVTNLLIAHGVRRRGELALRAALGATHGRLLRQILTENLLLAAIGGALAIIVAKIAIRVLIAVGSARLPRASAIELNQTVLGFGLFITTLIGVTLGLVLARQASHNHPRAALQSGGQRVMGLAGRARSAIVVVEFALALMLLVSSGLLLRSLGKLFAVNAGFDASHVLTMQIQTSGRRFSDPSIQHRFFEDALRAVLETPGVTVGALTSQLPLSGDLDEYGVRFEGRPDNEGHNALRYAVTPGYVEVMRIPIRRGRAFVATDRADAPLVALVSESFAKRELRGVDPIGKRVRVGPPSGLPYTIVGVVGDVRQVSLATDVTGAIYIPAVQWDGDNAMSLVVRTSADIASLVPALRRAIWSVDKDQPIVRIATMDELVARSSAERRFALIVFAAFAVAALVLAGAGIYGVLAGSVVERTREIGVRSALGASRWSIRALIVGQGMRLTLIGATVGIAAAAVTSRAMQSLLFGISPGDWPTYVGVTGLLFAVSALACWVPAWRASRVDPAITLRSS